MVMNSLGQHVQTKKMTKIESLWLADLAGLIDQFSVFPEWVRTVEVPNVDGMRH